MPPAINARTCRFVLAVVLSIAVSLPCLAAPDLAPAEHALNEGRINDCIAMLNSVFAISPKNVQAHLLLCRAYYSEEASDDAVRACEAAIDDGGSSSAVHDWMGRAYGQQASHTLIGAYGLAKKVKIEFEAAVAADPTNVDAANDLSEFYIGAPSMVGGGVQKALDLAERVQKTMPQAAHRIKGLAAQENKDYGTAENEFKAAVGVAGKPTAWLDLAEFYHKCKRYDEAFATLRKAEAADLAKDYSLVDMGSMIFEMKRQYPEGIRLLRVYLSQGARTDAGPACRAHWLLGKLLEKSGDKTGARQDFEVALKLASKYEKAQKGLDSL